MQETHLKPSILSFIQKQNFANERETMQRLIQATCQMTLAHQTSLSYFVKFKRYTLLRAGGWVSKHNEGTLITCLHHLSIPSSHSYLFLLLPPPPPPPPTSAALLFLPSFLQNSSLSLLSLAVLFSKFSPTFFLYTSLRSSCFLALFSTFSFRIVISFCMRSRALRSSPPSTTARFWRYVGPAFRAFVAVI